MRWRGSVRRERGWQGAFLVQRAREPSSPALTDHAVRRIAKRASHDCVTPRRPKSCGPAKSGLLFSSSTEGEKYRGDDGVSPRALPGRARNKPEPHRVRNAGCKRRDRGDDARVLFYFAHGAADALAHPAFRAPSFEGGTKESFGRPRAVITTGAMAHAPKRVKRLLDQGMRNHKTCSCLTVESDARLFLTGCVMGDGHDAGR